MTLIPSPASNLQQEPLKHIIQTLKATLPELRDRYGFISLGVFGSYVRGKQTPDSDLDLLVEFDPAVRFGLLTDCELENILALLKAGMNPPPSPQFWGNQKFKVPQNWGI